MSQPMEVIDYMIMQKATAGSTIFTQGFAVVGWERALASLWAFATGQQLSMGPFMLLPTGEKGDCCYIIQSGVYTVRDLLRWGGAQEWET